MSRVNARLEAGQLIFGGAGFGGLDEYDILTGVDAHRQLLDQTSNGGRR
jgi:hypothetical protein